jgi:hypothetical protein
MGDQTSCSSRKMYSYAGYAHFPGNVKTPVGSESAQILP